MAHRSSQRVLLFGSAHQRLLEVSNLLALRGVPAGRFELHESPDRQTLRGADLVVCVLDPDSGNSDAECAKALVARAQAENVAALVWGPANGLPTADDQLFDCVPAHVGSAEVLGRLMALANCAPIVKRAQQELKRLDRLGQHLNRYFEEIDQEMRLAGRLQRDFLPQTMPTAGPLSFSQLYRPAAWVSGDIFDVFPIGDRHVGMFIADAMGHGTAAGLMTMFLRRALVPLQSNGDGGRIRPPAEAMRQLHEELARQDFPNAQFVTAAYVIIDGDSLDVRLARGGHPHPLHVRPDGQIGELRCEGGLLGVVGMEPEFTEHRSRLSPGDKVILYTDGLEELFILGREPETEQAEFSEILREWAPLDADAFVSAVADYIDHQEGSLNPADDVTIVVAEVV